MSRCVFAVASCAFLMLGGLVQADSRLQSGPPVGARNDRTGFFPNWLTGPCAGKRLCPV
jgi:hypothetical protein